MTMESKTTRLSTKHFILLAVIGGMFVWVLFVEYQQSRKFEATTNQLLGLSASDVSQLTLFHNEWPIGESTAISDRVAIAAFVDGLKDMEQYSPNHEEVDHEVVALLEPQGIYIRLAIAGRFEEKALGSLGNFPVHTNYVHYGSFVSSSLYDWHKAYATSASSKKATASR